MPAPSPVNAELVNYLAQLWPGEQATAAAQTAVEDVLALPARQLANGRDYPVLGFHLTYDAGTDQLLMYLLTPGAFIRHEVLAGSVLTVTVPTRQLRQVVLRTWPAQEGVDSQGQSVRDPAGVSLTVEVEADTGASALELVGDGTGGLRGIARTPATTYELRATEDDGPGATGQLLHFARMVRAGLAR